MWWSVEGVTASGSYAGSGWRLGRSAQDIPSSWVLGMRSRSGEGKGSFHECTLPGPLWTFSTMGRGLDKGGLHGVPGKAVCAWSSEGTSCHPSWQEADERPVGAPLCLRSLFEQDLNT